MSGISVRAPSTPHMAFMQSFDSPERGVPCTFRAMADSEGIKTCPHVERIRWSVRPSGTGCEGCAQTGHSWLQLRMCMECGYVGCCDSSENKHALGHFRREQHPIARSMQPGEEWAWCYIDKLWFERLPLP